MKCKNTIAMVLAGAMLLPSNAFAADLSQYRDFPNDWSAKSLEQAIDDGLLNGSNGMIDAKGLLTRAQMAAIVSRAFGAAKMASLDDYIDVLPSAWYYSDMGKAVKMGAFQGANGLLNPDAPITREEAFTVLARAFALLAASKSADTPVGVVKSAGRKKQEKWLTTLGEMDFSPVDMTSLVIVGNKATYIDNGLMITPRGYAL